MSSHVNVTSQDRRQAADALAFTATWVDAWVKTGRIYESNSIVAQRLPGVARAIADARADGYRRAVFDQAARGVASAGQTPQAGSQGLLPGESNPMGKFKL